MTRRRSRSMPPGWVQALGATAIALFIGQAATHAQLVADAKLTAPDAAANDLLGHSTAVSGEIAVTGSIQDDVFGSNSGSAYVFTRAGGAWNAQQRLIPPDGAAGDNFGWSVAANGDTVVIGAPNDDVFGSNSGSAYVFTRVGGLWSLQQKLSAPDASANDHFGEWVAISGDTVVIGSPQNDAQGFNSGSAYVFTRSGGVWAFEQQLLANDGGNALFLGLSVSVSGDTALLGSRKEAAYVFTRAGGVWSQQAKLTASDGAAGDRFGWSVALDRNTAVIAASFDDAPRVNSGSAYVFARTDGAWSQAAKLVPADAAATDLFGFSVAVSDHIAVVGAINDDDFGFSSGSAYVFTRGGGVWSQAAKLRAFDGAAVDFFGYSVAVDDETAAIGAIFDDDRAFGSGSAYVFSLPFESECDALKAAALDLLCERSAAGLVTALQDFGTAIDDACEATGCVPDPDCKADILAKVGL